MFSLFAHGERLRPIVEEVEQMITGRHQEIAALVDYNQLKVLRSFQKHEVNEFHFAPSTGYGYDDSGRAALESIYADVFGGEDALVRPHIISGTHAIAISLLVCCAPVTTFFTLPESHTIRWRKWWASAERGKAR